MVYLLNPREHGGDRNNVDCIISSSHFDSLDSLDLWGKIAMVFILSNAL